MTNRIAGVDSRGTGAVEGEGASRQRAWRPSLHPARRPTTLSDRLELLLWVGVLALAFATPPTDIHGEPNAPLMAWFEASGAGGLCFYKQATGYDCGGCGLTRAFVQLGHGHPRVALALNPLAPLLFLWVLGRFGEVSVLNLAGRRLDYGIPNPWRWRFYGVVGVGLTGLFLTRLIAALLVHPSPL